MKKILYILLTINIKLFPVIIGVNCFAQQIDADARVKSQFIYGFTKYIGWPDQQYFKDFSIGVLGSDSAIYAELEKMARIKKVQGRLIKVKQFNSVDEILKVQLLYVNKKHGFDIDKILKKTKGKSILLVSENYPFNSSMINFVQIDRFQKFELNETRMKAENFIISPILINQAITSSEDWQQLYKKTETKLETEKKIVKEQKKEISEMQEEHKRQQKIIEEANKEIAKKQQEIEEQKTELVTLMEENEVQQQKINEKVETLKEQEQAITIQKEEIEKQKRNMFFQNEVLVEQLEQVQKQQGKIEKQKKVLSNQLSEL
ncbi:DUF4154 domain-containing protein, partial [Bacteroidales bacterium AH-315-I05]|nr:DUF4154 domain-containing protein [Bacteroidales bacterium AH-315-I05]